MRPGDTHGYTQLREDLLPPSLIYPTDCLKGQHTGHPLWAVTCQPSRDHRSVPSDTPPIYFQDERAGKKKKGHIACVEKEVLEYAFPVEGVTEAKLLKPSRPRRSGDPPRGRAGLKQR